MSADGCSSEPHDVLVTLSSCNDTQFTCADGLCVDMSTRCDQADDCRDGSDEKNCRIVHVDSSKYLKVNRRLAVDWDLGLRLVGKGLWTSCQPSLSKQHSNQSCPLGY